MWAETILSRDDIARLLVQAFPLTIYLGEDAEGNAKTDQSLTLRDLSEVSLLPDVGLRVTCKANVRWPVLGIDVPIALNTLTFTMLPEIVQTPRGDTLKFRMAIEHADFAGMPTLIDSRITETINAKLAGPDVDLSWDFTKELTIHAPLPAILEPLDAFAMRPAWGKIRITEEALVYAVSFHSAIVRRGETTPSELTGGVELSPSPAPSRATNAPDAAAPTPIAATASSNGASPAASNGGASNGSTSRKRANGAAITRADVQMFLDSPLASEIVRVGAFGLASGAAYFALRTAFRGRL